MSKATSVPADVPIFLRRHWAVLRRSLTNARAALPPDTRKTLDQFQADGAQFAFSCDGDHVTIALANPANGRAILLAQVPVAALDTYDAKTN